MVNKENLILIYEYLYIKITCKINYKLHLNIKQNKMIDSFILKNKEKGIDWLWDYLSFTFIRYKDVKTRFGTGIVQLNWIIGNKSLNYYKNRSKEQDFIIDKIKYNLELQNPIKKEKIIQLNNYKNYYRKNGNLVSCLLFNCFDFKNKYCLTCKNKKICSDFL